MRNFGSPTTLDRTCANIYLKYFILWKKKKVTFNAEFCTFFVFFCIYRSSNWGDPRTTAGWVNQLDISFSVSGDLFTMSQMNHLLKINMIYICPRGLLHDVIAALTFHFIVVAIDVPQTFAH